MLKIRNIMLFSFIKIYPGQIQKYSKKYQFYPQFRSTLGCSSSPCTNNGNCQTNSNNQNSYTCVCQPGYSGTRCETDIDECASGPCLNGSTCRDQLDSFHCQCENGFSGINCQYSSSVCESFPCRNGGNCISEGVGAYKCECMPGYTEKMVK